MSREDQNSLWTIAECSEMLATGKLSSVELTESYLARIAAQNADYHAFVDIFEHEALQAARVADAGISEGARRSPLHGIPLALKDIIDVRGKKTTCGSRITAGHIAAEDATVVRRLSEAGAVILGKATTWEFALGGPSFDLPWPPAVNPWDASRDPGGSSSGSGVAVASGLSPAALGSDTGGSIRSPSSLCGVTGLKPTFGLVPEKGVFPLSPSMDHVGPMARTSIDCALLLDALTGGAANCFAKPFEGDLKGMRIGALTQFYQEENPADPEVIALVENALQALRKLGAEIVELPRLSPMATYLAVGFMIMRAEAFAIHHGDLRSRPDQYGALGRERILMGGLISASDYIHAKRRREELESEFDAVFAHVDLVALPTTPTAAKLSLSLGAHATLDKPLYTVPFNVTRTPALSTCCGFTSDGLPIGLQLVGRRNSDAGVLRAGHAYEEATQWRSRVPAAIKAGDIRAVAAQAGVAPAEPSDAIRVVAIAADLPNLSNADLADLDRSRDYVRMMRKRIF